MCTDDDVRNEGGPKVERPFDPSEREARCASCPKHDRRLDFCPVLGTRRSPEARMCRYGYELAKGGKT